MMTRKSACYFGCVGLFGTFLLASCVHAQQPGAATDRFAGYEDVVRQTHEASLEARRRVLRETISEDQFWIKGPWGETIWCLAALDLNERADEANARLLERAKVYCQARRAAANDTTFKPEEFSDKSPWAYFAFGDYVRILCLFRAASPHYPGRLKPETEAAMTEALWWRVKSDSKVKDASLDNILVFMGTENHDLTRRPNYYLVASVLKELPDYKDRKYDDGHTAAEHYAAYNKFFREWPRQRLRSGLWAEVGSDTYQKYSWPALVNLHELSPDPIIRKRFGMLLDVAFIEEAQISVRGRRGGGRSRAGYGKNSFEKYKNVFYAPAAGAIGSSHHMTFETSRYQLSAEAIMLRKMAFPADAPFVIANRVLGEIKPGKPMGDQHDSLNPYVADSALINYAYRTPHYILGSTLQNPALSMPSPDDGRPVLKYHGISRQNRWSGMLFDDPQSRFPVGGAMKTRADNEMCAVFPEVVKTAGGRPQHSHWSFQHENVLFIQRITPGRNAMGSYSTGMMSIRFHGRKLVKVEEGGWIFASNGKAFVGVKFLDGRYKWDDTGEVASPAAYAKESTTRVLMHAGDLRSYPSFEAFRVAVLACPRKVQEDRVAYRASAASPKLEWFRYVVADHAEFKLPRIDGKPIDLRPDWTYRSPYLNGKFGEDRVTVTVGPIKKVYDMATID
jgi:hypothetical protein